MGSPHKPNPPTATYRMQFHEGFTFADAAAVLPYLKQLGISHLYASPILKARPGSTHGYDIVDPGAINPELGGLEGFHALADAIKAQGLSLLLDIVPNHMGVGGSDNLWWLSVLEWGEHSPFADTFDIDWERLGAHGKLVAPFLGGQYGVVLERGDLKLTFDAASGSFSVWHYEHKFPICPLTYPDILDRAVAADTSEEGNGIEDLLRLAEELRALAQEPGHRRPNMPAACERLKKRIAVLAQRPEVAQSIEQALAVFNGVPRLSESFGALHRLLEQQAYRLSFWRVAASDINYRRFFDIDGLAGVRIEEPAVFQRVHRLVFDLVRRGLVHGLRIDHIDGLADPRAYIEDLQHELGPDFYIIAEKILEPGEELRHWPLAGTTGYEMLNIIDGIFVDAEAESAFDSIYAGLTGDVQNYEAALGAAKTQVLAESFSSELESLVSDTKRIADANRLTRDYSVNMIRVALADIINAFPVYRTYITPTACVNEDNVLVAGALRKAKVATSLPDRGVHDFIGSILRGTVPMGSPGRAPKGLVERFRRRFQQLTGPVMAKSLEDTLFYRYVRFLALNEVGGEPRRFGVSPAEFHAANMNRARQWPLAMTATATHDTKRGEDARARLLGLSEVPQRWQEMVGIWQEEAGSYTNPDANDQYMLFQTIIGAWPLELLNGENHDALQSFRDRLLTYIPKALREGKRKSKWIEPNSTYETAAKDLVLRLLGNDSAFIDRILPFVRDVAQRGMLISLARTILKCTLPGAPDFYQGTTLWDFSLVDPDNRRPVDYSWPSGLSRGRRPIEALLESWHDGAIKHHVIAKLLGDRAARPLFYANADYDPIEVAGTGAGHVLCFIRSFGQGKLVVVVPRLQGQALNSVGLPLGEDAWSDTSLELPSGSWHDLLGDRRIEISGATLLAKLFYTVPFSVLSLTK
ncbi:MAG: malto-oligosyltrehalose synthase [Beijerinckiaceae bacterium]|nr:malto-oligosyltrehalose synthase [Beijerinckiaceae bacterium]